MNRFHKIAQKLLSNCYEHDGSYGRFDKFYNSVNVIVLLDSDGTLYTGNPSYPEGRLEIADIRKITMAQALRMRDWWHF